MLVIKIYAYKSWQINNLAISIVILEGLYLQGMSKVGTYAKISILRDQIRLKLAKKTFKSSFWTAPDGLLWRKNFSACYLFLLTFRLIPKVCVHNY